MIKDFFTGVLIGIGILIFMVGFFSVGGSLIGMMGSLCK